MFAKITLLTALFVGVSCRHIAVPYGRPFLIDDEANIINDDFEDLYFGHGRESVHPMYQNSRVRRQASGVMSTNPDGSFNVMGKLPLAGNDKNAVSAIGVLNGVKKGGTFDSASAGLALDNVNGHGLSLTGKHIPAFGNQLSGAGHANLFHNDHHDLSANAFATRSFPKNPVIPNFNTYGGGIDYTFNNKVGASLGMSHTPLFKQTDYSAMGHLNVFRNPTSSLNLNAGATRSMSPFIPKSSWQPTFGLTFSKSF